MPGQTAEDIRFGSTGKILVADVGETEPANASAEWPAGWVDLGLASEDGVQITPGKQVQYTRAWQVPYPVRATGTDQTLRAKFQLLQFNSDTVALAFGGGEWEETSVGELEYLPPPVSEVDERALAVEFEDDGQVVRWIWRRGLVTDVGTINVKRFPEVQLEITFDLLAANDGGDPYRIITNSGSFVPTAS